MTALDTGNKAKSINWNSLILDMLPANYVANSSDLIWALDTEMQLVFANECYLDFIVGATEAELQSDDEVQSDHSMKDKWNYIYSRALSGEQFHIITMLASTGAAMMIDANLIPIISEDHILGTVCLARSTSSIKLPTIVMHDSDVENNSLQSKS